MTDVLNLLFKKHLSKFEGTSPGENQFDVGPHGGEELLYHLMCQFFHDVHGWSKLYWCTPGPPYMIMRIMSVEAGAISLGAETRPATGSVNAEVMADTSKTIIVVASEATCAGTNSTVPGSAVEV